MKSLFSILIATFAITSLKAQYANTSWKGFYKIPDPQEMILQFKKDTLLLIDPQSHEPVETMNYKTHGDTVSVTKISGESDCDGQEAVYKMTIKDNKLFISVVNDECVNRATSAPDEPLEKIEE